MYKLEFSIIKSIVYGLSWLSNNQNEDGSFGNISPITTTALAIQSFENYARMINVSALSDTFKYHNQVELAFQFLFNNAKFNNNGIYFEENGSINIPTGAVLGAIVGLDCPDCVIGSGETPQINNLVKALSLNGSTFGSVANQMISYLSSSQNSNGAWSTYSSDYDVTNTSSSGASSYVVDGLSSASSYGYTVPSSVGTNLQNWVDYIQNKGEIVATSDIPGRNFSTENNTINNINELSIESSIENDNTIKNKLAKDIDKLSKNNCNKDDDYGGGGDTSPEQGVNIENTAILIQQMYFLNYNCNNDNLKLAIQYIANNWYNPVGYLSNGWADCQNIDYKATYEIMNAFTSYCVGPLRRCNCNQRIYWFSDIVCTLINRQINNYYWPASNLYYSQSEDVIATIWAILTLEKAELYIY